MPKKGMSQDPNLNVGDDQTKKDNLPPTEEEDKFSEFKETLENISDTVSSLNEKIEEFDTRFDTLEEKAPLPQPPEDIEGPKDWNELQEFIEKKADEIANSKIEKVKKDEEENIRQTEEETKRIEANFDQQVEQLEKSGKLPKVVDQNNSEDPGRMARRELFGLGAKLGTANLGAISDVIEKLHNSGITFDVKTNKFLKSNQTPTGASAPVASSSSKTPPGSSGPTYDEIHKAKSFDELIRRANLE